MDANQGTYFYCYDGNGNVAALVNAANGAIAAQYEYGPFGELLRATGPMAFANPFRFSSKYQDDETDFLYYGHRYYNPSTGRWLSRDPVEGKTRAGRIYTGLSGTIRLIFGIYLGWEWKVVRSGGDRATATCDCK